MGYTCADTTLTIDCTCITGGMLTIATITSVSEYKQLTISHKKESQEVFPNVTIKGGFYDSAHNKKQLFLAGHIHKPSRKACIAAGKIYPNQKVLECIII